MVTKGIITSIDFNGNTCQVRIPLFETAGNDPIISTAVVSNTPGSYNGYKVGDVVLVAFEDGKMETPVVIGKLYLGAEKEKADPRGSLNTESLVAAKTATVPADTKLTTDTDKNLPNTMNPYANLSSIANNLNKLNTDVNYLDVFTNNQFNSVITDVNKQGEQLRSEIKQTASNIEAKVDKEHDSTTTGLGWNLTDTKWTIDATNTAWPTNKLTLFEVDRDGQVIINGNVRIGGYPQSRTRFYKKLAAGSDSPKAPDTNTATEKLPDEGWRETYEWENTCHIWETIQTIIYDTNDKGELELKITYSTPVDITGAAGEQGISIKSQIIYYAMVDSDITHVEKPDYVPKGGSNQDNHVYGNSTDNNIIDLTAASPVKGYGWSTTPHEYIDGWNYYTSVLTIYSDDNQAVSPAINHRNFADPVKAQELDGVYELAQGKSKNFYSEIDPAGTRGNDAYGLTMRKGYCWFDTGYTQISTPEAKSDYLGKWLRIQDANGDYVVKSGENPVRLIQWKDGITDQRYNMIKVGPDNIDTLISNKTIVVGTTEAFETGILSQWNGTNWVDISGELVTNKLTTNYINAMDITSKKIQVLDSNNDTLFLADGINGNGEVNIGGFTVDSNRLYAGNPGTDDSIEIAKVHNLIAYKSNNQGKDSTSAICKIKVNKDITNLTVYIRSYAETDYDYTIISTPNAESCPNAYNDNYVKAHTRGNKNSSSALNGYTKVEYDSLKQNDYIYVVYRKDASSSNLDDTGYLLIPKTAAISIEAVDDTSYTFERDASLDIKEAGASLKVGSNFSVNDTGAIRSTSGTIGGFTIDSNRLYAGNPGADNGIELAAIGTNKASIKVGSNFSVDSTGAIKSTRGTIGNLAINDNGLSYESIFKIDPTVSNWGSSEKQKATVVAGSTLVQNTLILPGQWKNDYELSSYYWPAFDREGFKVLYTSNWTDSAKTYKLGEYDLWDLAGIPIVSSYNHFMTKKESLACFGKDRSETVGWGAPIIYANRHINIGKDWVEVDLYSYNNIRKILTVVCTTYVQPTEKTDSTSTTPTFHPDQSGNLFVSYDDYSDGKFWIRSNNDTVTVSILAIGVAPIIKSIIE